MKSSLDTRGMENYLEDLAKAGQDIDSIAGEALTAGGEVLLSGMVRRAPENLGNLIHHLKLEGPNHEGNYHFVNVGISEIDLETEMYFFYQENGSARNPAHPYIRPTYHEDWKKARNKMVEVFKARLGL